MAAIRQVLAKQIAKYTELQNLADACGEQPSRDPPRPSTIKKVRQAIARQLGLSVRRAEATHPASPWKYNVVRAVQQACGDPDTAVADWLEHGAPFGVAVPVEPGGLLPLVVESPILQEEDLYERELFRDNHKSFKATVDDQQPALEELRGLVDSGFARLCTDSAEAERWLGQAPVVSPLGNVTKPKPDGTVKNRLIQDFRASSVNAASSVSERQVLPRFVDHARDLAMLSARGSSVGVFVLDFKHAFMTVPLAREEMPYNTSVVPESLTRTRPPLDDVEPTTGTALVWRVLGGWRACQPIGICTHSLFCM